MIEAQMNEVDSKTFRELQYMIQLRGAMISTSPHVVYQLEKAWRLLGSDGWYDVEIVDNVRRCYRGMFDTKRGIIYLDVNSIMGLVQDRIDAALHAYNAGHDPRFRGM